MESATRLFFLTLLLSVVTICTHAQEKVYFTVDAPQTVVSSEMFRIAYSLNAEVESSVEPYLSDTKDFVVLMGPARSQSSSIEQTNGVQTKKVTTTYTYTFQVNGTGDYTIPYCRIKTQKGTYQSNPLSIKVLPNENRKTESSITPTNANPKPTTNTSNSGDVFVQVELSQTSVSTNDSLIATVKLYSQRSIISLGRMTFPIFEGFTVQEISLPEIRQIVQERYKGKNYYTAVLRQYMLHPKQDGQLTITSGSYNIVVPQKKQQSNNLRDFFDSPKQSADTLTLTSQAVTLMVHLSPNDASAVSANTIEPQSDPVKAVSNESTIEKPTTENKSNRLKITNDETRKVLLYSSVTSFALLLVVYFSKLRTVRDTQYAKRERAGKTATKPSFVWHLLFITGIILLIGCIAVLL